MARLDITHPPEVVCMLQLEPGCVWSGLARFDWEEGDWRVTDLGAREGTRVNGQRVQSAMLRDGDTLAFGAATAVFSLEPSISHSAAFVSLASFRPAAELDDPEELASDYELLRAAHEVGQAIGARLDADEVYRIVLAFCARRLPVDAGYLLRRSEGAFRVSATTGTPLRPRTQELPVSSTVLARLVQEKRGFLLAEPENELPGAVSVQVLGIESLLAVPLVVGDEVVGAIVLHNHRLHHSFGRRDLYVTAGIAAQLSLVLEATVRARFARFLPQQVIGELVEGGLEPSPGGREGQIAVLYCDIRRFTPLSRRLGPGPTMELLNEYYEATVPIVFAHGGMVDKFVGDELMAVWGVPAARPDDLHRAIGCALALQEAIAALSHRREGAGIEGFACGIGINAGPAWVGLVGTAERVQYTVIGDTVNLGARLCGEAGPAEIVTVRSLLEGWPGPFEPMQPRCLKGSDAPLQLARLGVSPDSGDARLLASWQLNARPWTRAVREGEIESRRLVTDSAVVEAVMSRSPRTALDLGCGEGWLSRALSGRGVQMVGVDAVPALVEAARSAGGGEFRVCSYEQIAAGELALEVDVVVANFSLTGKESVEGVLARVPSLLAPAGSLVLQTGHPAVTGAEQPYADGWREGSWAGFHPDFTSPAPWYFRTLGGWISLLARCGLRLLELREPLDPRTGRPASIVLVAGR